MININQFFVTTILLGIALRYLYTFLFYLLLPFAFLRLLWRSKRIPEYRKHWAERLGFCSHHLSQCIWIHAVSVGETFAATPLIQTLKTTYPTIPIVVTNMTPTGALRVKATFGETILQTYIPYDVPDAVSRFLNRINPVIGIIIETEFWPNLFAACKKRDIPLVITNARLSAKSAKGYALIPSLMREMFSAVTLLSSQGKADSERFILLGMANEKIITTGNLKFDMTIPADLPYKKKCLSAQMGTPRPVWIAASTHPSEEEIMLAAHKKIRAHYPDALLILVPRHPNRFDAIASLILQQHFTLARRSRNDTCLPEIQVYLGDTMGELLLLYSIADVACVAGSFAPIGGHNVLEPALLQKPIITGPQLFNFAEISELLLSARAMIIVQNAEELANEVLHFFNDEKYRFNTGQQALHVIEQNRGALKKQLESILTLLQNRLH